MRTRGDDTFEPSCPRFYGRIEAEFHIANLTVTTTRPKEDLSVLSFPISSGAPPRSSRLAGPKESPFNLLACGFGYEGFLSAFIMFCRS